MAEVKTFRDLQIWQKSMALVTAIYQTTLNFPNSEQFSLTSQIRRSAVSVPSNIAEGFGRQSLGDYLRFLQIAFGSLFELQTQIEIAANLNYLQKAEFDSLYSQSREIERMMSSLIQKLKLKK
ncbi:four helix bundle protein [Persicitalea jodogahamensis]|uniref:Four helix bundle protein n=1 Tax=Persicitalea jodogahamensis TaxID=402147 RepID=A0A8J3D068_9BACT|nr:four helix bundle protein [Persicitalea jodogahamensis]GHB52195.1 four helix bundle protein [Persicitalea jodogahamensis]